MHILTIANKKQTQKLKQDKQKQLEKENGREVLNRQNRVLGLFFPLFLLLLHSTPGSHTREESKIAHLPNAKMNRK